MEIKSPPRPTQGHRRTPDTKKTPQSPQKTKGKREVPTWVLLWGVIILIVLVVFLANKGAIDEALKNTGFVNAISSQKTVQVLRQTSPQGAIPSPTNTQSLPPGPTDPALAPLLQKPDEPIKEEPEKKPEPQAPQGINGPKRNTVLYFVDIQNESQIHLIPSIREVPATEAPLSTAIKTLLEGPSDTEQTQKGLSTLIPSQTTLLSVRIVDDTVLLNFSEEFQFNTLGMEGFDAQLRQVVYTATEFPQVKRVQILISGQRKNYLGADGVFIGEPLTRDSFMN